MASVRGNTFPFVSDPQTEAETLKSVIAPTGVAESPKANTPSSGKLKRKDEMLMLARTSLFYRMSKAPESNCGFVLNCESLRYTG